MNILFIVKMIEYGDYLPVCYLSAVAKHLGHKTALCILDDHDVYEMVERIRPDILAYSSNVLGHDQMVRINKELKLKYDFISIMGGPHPTYMPELFESSSMDVFCIGEGELVFQEFLERIEKGESFDDVKNLITVKGRNEIRPLADLSTLYPPDRSITLDNSNLKNTSKKSFFTSRGCPFSCAYCCNDFFKQIYKGKGKVFRRFSVDQIIAEMKSVKASYKMEFVKLGDDLFALKVDKWLEDFLSRYKKEIGLSFNCYLRLDCVNEELLSLLRKSGCYSVHLSVDSISEHVREHVLNRKWKKVDVEEKIKLIHSFGINTWVNFMVAAPESTVDDDLGVVYMAKRTNISYVSTSTTIPLKNTSLWHYCVEKGYINKDYEGQMDQCAGKSPLNCFSRREKDIRYNVFCLANVVSHWPTPFFQLGMLLIRYAPSNRLFKMMRDWGYRYALKTKIFKIQDNQDTRKRFPR